MGQNTLHSTNAWVNFNSIRGFRAVSQKIFFGIPKTQNGMLSVPDGHGAVFVQTTKQKVDHGENGNLSFLLTYNPYRHADLKLTDQLYLSPKISGMTAKDDTIQEPQIHCVCKKMRQLSALKCIKNQPTASIGLTYQCIYPRKFSREF